jgi:hypothetical protein
MAQCRQATRRSMPDAKLLNIESSTSRRSIGARSMSAATVGLVRLQPRVNDAKPSSSQPSRSPIVPFAQRRSSFVQLPTSLASEPCQRLSSVLHSLPEPLPTVLFVQPPSAPEPTRTPSECQFPFHMLCQKPQAQHRFREAPSSTDLVPSLRTGRSQFHCSSNFSLARDCIK